MLSPVRLGVVGLGAMGAEMLTAASDHPDVRVVAAADLDPSRVAAARERHPDVDYATDPWQVVQGDGVQAVYLATPPRHHAELAIAAMRAGRAVFCEKPLAASIDEARAMVDAAHATGVATAVNFALADRHAVLEIERALRSGELGALRGVDVRLTFPTWPRAFQADAAWLDGRAQGGFVREVLSHFLYLTDRLLGPVEPRHVALLHDPATPERSEVAAVGVLTAGGVPVTVSGHAGVGAPERYDWHLHGSRRSYRLRDWGELAMAEGDRWVAVPLEAPRGSERTRLAGFAQAVRGDRPRWLPDFAAGLRVAEVVEAFHAARDGASTGASAVR